MAENENDTKELKFYSQKSIGIATFLGGPMASGYLIRENYRSLDQPDKGRSAFILGFVATAVIFIVIFSLPESIIDKVPNQIIPAVYTLIIYLIVEKIQGKVLTQHKEHENQFYSTWKAAGIGLISLAVMAIGLLSYAFLSPEAEAYDQYDAEMETFFQNETETMIFYEHLGTKQSNTLLRELDRKIIPKWEENIQIIEKTNEMADLPDDLIQQNALLLKYAKLRLKAFKLFKKAIEEDTDQYDWELENTHTLINKLLEEMN
ncbi:hypothetical protein O3Q51_08300 [Cryomorphaceae bacterium 1068]|nr:hypothetical protein [Cryomorphaceae bacterium 1068]